VMRLLVLVRGAATAIVAVVSFGVNAADIDYPPPVVGRPQYGMAPPPPIASPQVIIIPGSPPVGVPPYGSASPVAPRVDVAPAAPCPPTWRCWERGCGWQPGCAPPAERYSGQYESGPVYPRPGSPGPQLYSPDSLPGPEPYPGPYSPQIYPDPRGPYSR
jgi:hypothetical protein